MARAREAALRRQGCANAQLQAADLATHAVLEPAAKALLERNPNPTEDEVRWALSGNLCRCTGYQNIVKAVLWAADKMRAEQN